MKPCQRACPAKCRPEGVPQPPPPPKAPPLPAPDGIRHYCHPIPRAPAPEAVSTEELLRSLLAAMDHQRAMLEELLRRGHCDNLDTK